MTKKMSREDSPFSEKNIQFLKNEVISSRKMLEELNDRIIEEREARDSGVKKLLELGVPKTVVAECAGISRQALYANMRREGVA